MKQDTQSALVLAASSVSSMLLAAGGGSGYITAGVAIVVLLVVVSLRSSWLGLLSLFPMLFAINPAPVAIGPAEASFALLAATSLFVSLFEEANEDGWGKLVRRYQWVVAIALVFALANLLMAKQNGVPFSDWLRGAVPFCFLIFALPLARTLVGRPERLAWIGWGVFAYLLILMSHIVGYYIAHALYEPFWIIGEGSLTRRITAAGLADYPEAVGPIYDRVTLYLPRSTTVLLAAGLVMTFVIAVRVDDRRLRLLALIMAALSLVAMLATQTRSMLLIASCVIMLFLSLLAWRDRHRLARGLVTLIFLIAWGGAAIWTFDMESVWSSRIKLIYEATKGATKGATKEATKEVDPNVTSRQQEIQLAWEKFKQNPVIGNGLGIKNPVVYVGENGSIEKRVAYIHNWFFYTLMVGGLTGCVLYAWLLFAPVLLGWRQLQSEPLVIHAFRFGMLAFIGYGLTFAVFRHIDFNLLVAVAWGMIMAKKMEVRCECGA